VETKPKKGKPDVATGALGKRRKRNAAERSDSEEELQQEVPLSGKSSKPCKIGGPYTRHDRGRMGMRVTGRGGRKCEGKVTTPSARKKGLRRKRRRKERESRKKCGF